MLILHMKFNRVTITSGIHSVSLSAHYNIYVYFVMIGDYPILEICLVFFQTFLAVEFLKGQQRTKP